MRIRPGIVFFVGIDQRQLVRAQIDQGIRLSRPRLCSPVWASMIVGIIIDIVGYKPVAVSGFILSGLCLIAAAEPTPQCSPVLPLAAIALNTAGNTLPAVLFGGKIRQPPEPGQRVLRTWGFAHALIVSFLSRGSYEKAVSVVALIYWRLSCHAAGNLSSRRSGFRGDRHFWVARNRRC